MKLIPATLITPLTVLKGIASFSITALLQPIFTRLLFSALLIFQMSDLIAGTTAENPQTQISKLEQEYQAVSTAAYREISGSNSPFPSQASTEELLDTITKAEKSKNTTQVIGIIVTNMDVIKHHLDANTLQVITRILLTNHADLLAQDLLKYTELHGDDYMLGRLNFELAKHFAEQNQWRQAISKLNTINIGNTLPKKDADEAYVLQGAALQWQKKHREAVKLYDKIPPASAQYRIAQLNTAIAFIRQDWWTDAKIAIDKAIAADPQDTDGLTNRLYTVLGFSQLQNGFYRNARESFRNVKVKSTYSNRALLGLGMAALHQEDFVGALNAFNHLKQKDPTDISVMESYLLSAFALEKLKQQKTASASYSEAISFFEEKSQYYSLLYNHLVTQRSEGKIDQTLINTINHDLHRIQPQLLPTTEEINTLNQLLAYNPSNAQQQAIKQLNSRLYDYYMALANDAIQQKQAIINSYLSQSRFGLAKLYDSP